MTCGKGGSKMKFGKEFDAKLEAIILTIYQNGTAETRANISTWRRLIKELIALEIHGGEDARNTV